MLKRNTLIYLHMHENGYIVESIFTKEGVNNVYCIKELYDKAIIDKNDIEGINIRGKIQLEYYKTTNNLINDEYKKYGIKIVKKHKKIYKEMIESKEIDNISDEETKVERLLKLLVSNKVTPIGLDDVLSDLI